MRETPSCSSSRANGLELRLPSVADEVSAAETLQFQSARLQPRAGNGVFVSHELNEVMRKRASLSDGDI